MGYDDNAPGVTVLVEIRFQPFELAVGNAIEEDRAPAWIRVQILQGIEEYENGIIVYSLGNFCFPNYSSPHMASVGYRQKNENKESFIFQCSITNEGIEEHKIVPIILNDQLQPEIALNEIELRIQTKIQYLSKPLNKTGYKKFFIDYSNKIKNNRLFSFLKNKGISGILKRLNPVYIRALIIALNNFLLERRHRRQFMKKEEGI